MTTFHGVVLQSGPWSADVKQPTADANPYVLWHDEQCMSDHSYGLFRNLTPIAKSSQKKLD
jgi:hypothetical protein